MPIEPSQRQAPDAVEVVHVHTPSGVFVVDIPSSFSAGLLDIDDAETTGEVIEGVRKAIKDGGTLDVIVDRHLSTSGTTTRARIEGPVVAYVYGRRR